MIYEYPSRDVPLKQGDIFVGLPRVEMSLKRVPIITEQGTQIIMEWNDLAKEGNAVTAVLVLKPVKAIIISQDCDASRADDITLCEIRPFSEVERKSIDTKKIQKWINMITQQARLNQKWFYLTPCSKIGFEDRMGVDFNITIRIPRLDLEDLKHLRKGKLNEVAGAHFRERIAGYFRRYAFNEWYPLDPDEMKVYNQKYPDAELYPWQIQPKIIE
jgi:hypothetical protein